MRWLCVVLVWFCWLPVSPALAQLYRWTDAQGKVHITDNPDTIPPAYRERARSSTSEEPLPDSKSNPATETTTVAPRSRLASPPAQQSPTASPAAQQGPTLQRWRTLQQDIATARQERQGYLEQLRQTRTVHVTPEFVRRRRTLAEVGRALVAVEQRLDTLTAEVERLQTQIETPQASSAIQRARSAGLDAEGHTSAYWQQRARPILPRLQQAQHQRRELLAQLTTLTTDETRPAERQGRGLLQYAEALQQVETELEAATQAWHALQQEALRAGAPPEWLQ